MNDRYYFNFNFDNQNKLISLEFLFDVMPMCTNHIISLPYYYTSL